ncbi:hypothetical protein OH76DRAFT_1365053 [Lentinus brumalis]|uniref:Arrestin-like N-terminal domain-containing protein n=1 Tax=Lentinus brumalis TaxID=2498619 RepID=A0A371CLK3_9APHY|nr:hypothetical protein OH76DRAFT_1365053 [Polyporus brumalis]
MTSSIQVVIPPTTYCSGSYLEGEVQLNFRHLRENGDRFEKIWVTLRGRAICVCADNDSEDHETIPLFDLSRMLWTNGSEYPPPDSDVLRLFFRFQLPDDIPPSLLDRTGPGGTAGVLYSLTTVAVRAGRFTKPWKQHTPIVIVPRDDVSPLLTRALVTDAFAWRTGHKSQQVRRALWGDYATVRIELFIPGIPVFPLFTPVPFKVDVKTTTAKLTRRIPTDGRADAGPTQIFPIPPADASQFAFQLVRRTTVRVQKREETIQSVTACTPCEHVGVNIPSKEWVPMPDALGWSHLSSNQERGVWVQRAQYSSKLVFNVPPTFSIGDRLAWEYHLKLKVPFPGSGNDVEVEMPVTIVSGIDKPVPRKQHQPHSHDPRLKAWAPSTSELSLPS